ncbi:22909_t:CDS:1 [Gigaspora margarita]|uniref:22909_t:CDS:1 n=1 Tax=Gigaspora margarita TaxID=4874 RepID=A0ABM8VY92_GIGMA|nr:22909_t:CDS:1 [Gigaspora margarita]
MSQQNIQYTCSICLKNISNYRSVTNDLKLKIDSCPDKEYYQGLRLNIDKLCSKCYMRIINSYQHQIPIINRNNLIEVSESNIFTDSIETSRSNTPIDLMETSRSNTPTNLIETSNLINLIELIKIQKEELIYENKLNEINQQITDIKINITDDTISMDKENFNQLIKLILQKDLKIEALNNHNNQNNLILTNPNNLGNYNILIILILI